MMFSLQLRISRLFRGKWQSWLKEDFLLVMRYVMILRLVYLVFRFGCLRYFVYIEILFLGTGSAIKSSKGGHARYIWVWTLFKVLPLKLFHDQYLHCQLCSAFPVVYPFKACPWWIREERRRVALRHLAAEFLGVKIQNGEHCPVSSFNLLWWLFLCLCAVHLQDDISFSYVVVCL